MRSVARSAGCGGPGEYKEAFCIEATLDIDDVSVRSDELVYVDLQADNQACGPILPGRTHGFVEAYDA